MTILVENEGDLTNPITTLYAIYYVKPSKCINYINQTCPVSIKYLSIGTPTIYLGTDRVVVHLLTHILQYRIIVFCFRQTFICPIS